MSRLFLLLGRLCSVRVTIRIRAKSPPAILPNVAIKISDVGNSGLLKSSSSDGPRVMVVVDSSPEAKCALQWALSHTVQSHHTLVLLHIITPPKRGIGHQISLSPKGSELFSTMMSICEAGRPEVQVEVALVESNKKGPAIVEAAREHGIALLVLGRRRQMMIRQLMVAFAGRSAGDGKTVEYCIEKASCMTIAVRKKSRKVGGFLITTKRHRDFWLLA